jgi:hypothetical protein
MKSGVLPASYLQLFGVGHAQLIVLKSVIHYPQ